MRYQVFTLFASICCLCFNGQLRADEIFYQQFQPDLEKNFQLKIEQLTQKIEKTNPSDIHKLDALLFDRGVVFLFCGEYEYAINDFTHILVDHHGQHSGKNIARALWGRTLSYAFLGRTDEFTCDLYAFSELIGLHNDCNCSHTSNTNIFESDLSQEKPILCTLPHFFVRNSAILLCDAFCENTVDNTVKFLKTMCAAIRDNGIKATLYIFIDGLGDKAKLCCRGRGFWRDCVDPMVKIAEKWKLFGVPNDPYWD